MRLLRRSRMVSDRTSLLLVIPSVPLTLSASATYVSPRFIRWPKTGVHELLMSLVDASHIAQT